MGVLLVTFFSPCFSGVLAMCSIRNGWLYGGSPRQTYGDAPYAPHSDSQNLVELGIDLLSAGITRNSDICELATQIQTEPGLGVGGFCPIAGNVRG